MPMATKIYINFSDRLREQFC